MDNPKLKYLDDVPWDNSLKLSNGKTVHGLEQLPMIIKFSDDEVFSSHVTDQKNDFANWIRDVVGYAELADKLLNIKTKDEFLKFMDQEIIDIKKSAPPLSISVPVPNVVAQSTLAPQPVPVQQSSPVVQPTVPIQPITSATPTVSVQSTAPVQPTDSIQQSSPVVQPTVPIQPITSATPTVSVQSTAPVQPTDSIQQSSPVVQPTVSIQPITPDLQPVPISQSPVPQSATPQVIAPVAQSVPVVENTVPVAETVAPVTVPVSTPEVSPIVDEKFDFEEIFNVLISELEQDVLMWDAQTS